MHSRQRGMRVVGRCTGMRSRQTGITFIGFAVLAAMVGLLGFAGLKLYPAYYQNFRVKGILEDIKAEFDGQSATPQTIRRAIEKRIDIEMIYGLNAQDFEILKSENGYTVRARYEQPLEFLGNVSFLVNFDDEVEIRL